jgi:glucosylceramidase
VTIDSKTHAVTRSGQYWAFAHFSRTIERGALRFESQSPLADLSHVACENPRGDKVLVLTNPGQERTVSVKLHDLECEVKLERNSVTTLTWT